MLNMSHMPHMSYAWMPGYLMVYVGKGVLQCKEALRYEHETSESDE